MFNHCRVSGAGSDCTDHKMVDWRKQMTVMAKKIDQFNQDSEKNLGKLLAERTQLAGTCDGYKKDMLQLNADIEALRSELDVRWAKKQQQQDNITAMQARIQRLDKAIVCCQPVPTAVFANCSVCLVAKPVDKFVNRCATANHPACETCMSNLNTCHMCRGALGAQVPVDLPLDLV